MADDALALLSRRVTTDNNFAIYSEGYVDQIAELRQEIEAYEKTKDKPETHRNGGKSRPGRKAS